ncbi:MAG: 16S rRNA (cytosine(967)-C(5))-methyltransferase RsmB [Succinivibrionaceae bacterium]
MKTNHLNSRAIASKIVDEVASEKKQLNIAIKNNISTNNEFYSFILDICYNTIRYYISLDFVVNSLYQKKFKEKHHLAKNSLIIGIYQILYTNTPTHAIVNETVNAIKQLGFTSFSSLANALLHKCIREKDIILKKIQKSYETNYAFPQWLIKKIKQYYPQETSEILASYNQHPPMWIRVNTNKIPIKKYLEILKINSIDFEASLLVPTAVLIKKPCAVEELPFFKNGLITIQDISAQYASTLLDAEANDIVLDCCCAPGGKTSHILELYPNIKEIVAIDNQENRIKRVHENLQRLNLSNKVKVICCDATDSPSTWSPYKQYDKIMLDAPCSATGVIRRHPDIKLLRTEKDIINIKSIQNSILNNIWDLLKINGILVYVTCSILKEENENNIESFLKQHKDAQLIPISNSNQIGLQVLPNHNSMDGFFYAKIKKIIKKE